MNAKLLLAALLLVVVMVGSGGESSAKKLNSRKFSRKSALEKRGWNRNRRDLSDFQTQLNASTFLDISDPTSCSPFPCVSSVNDLWCISFCTSVEGKFANMVEEVVDCYKGGICGKNLTNFQLPNPVNISIAPGNYNGQCYLYGPQVTVTLKNETNFVDSAYVDIGYYITEEMYYDFTGLTLYCRPNLASSTCNSGCCGNDLLTEVVCLVQLITGSLGLPLNLLHCDCSCGGSFFGRREVRVPTDSPAPFQIPITVTQHLRFYISIFFGSFQAYYYSYDTDYSGASVTFATLLPTAYANDITTGIVTVFQDYNTFHTLQNNFGDVISKMLVQLYTNTCDPCSAD